LTNECFHNTVALLYPCRFRAGVPTPQVSITPVGRKSPIGEILDQILKHVDRLFYGTKDRDPETETIRRRLALDLILYPDTRQMMKETEAALGLPQPAGIGRCLTDDQIHEHVRAAFAPRHATPEEHAAVNRHLRYCDTCARRALYILIATKVTGPRRASKG
jgi:hypothetical protein